MRYTSMDFHTSPLVPEIGKLFDPKKFADTVKNANIESVLVFAKCHHGYTYYPTKVGTKHPNLSFDLLGEQLKALRGAGVKAPVYITVGWSKLDADGTAVPFEQNGDRILLHLPPFHTHALITLELIK